MKVLHPGWSQEVTCTGHGSGAPGCHSRLLVGKGDLFKSCSVGHQAHGAVEWFVTIRCPECGRTTDLGRLDDPDVATPEIRANLPPMRAWEAHQVRAGEVPNMSAGVLSADLFNALREHTEALRAARVAPAPPPETRTPAGDQLRGAAGLVIGRLHNTGSVDLYHDVADALIAAANAYDALPAAPAPDPDRVVVDRAILEELRVAAVAILCSPYAHSINAANRLIVAVSVITTALTSPAPPATPPPSPSPPDPGAAAP